jgi:hypothetical protein
MIVVSASSTQLFRLHCKAIAALAGLHSAVMMVKLATGHDHLLGVAAMFRMDLEANLPTFAASVALLLLALAAYEAGRADRERQYGWQLAMLCAAFMAVDEASALHDRVSQALQALSGQGGPLWTIAYLVLALAVGALGSRWLASLPASTRNGLVGAGALYVGSAVFLEMAAGLHVRAVGTAVAGAGFPLAAMTLAEEAGEMVAVAFAIRTVLRHQEVLSDGAETGAASGLREAPTGLSAAA